MPDGSRLFALVRPYPGFIRQRVFDFVTDLGFEGRDDLVLDAGTPDGEAAAWVGRQEIGLLVLPFHIHRDRHGEYVDGTGVAVLLAPAWAERWIPILMPVSRFSWSARFPRRLAEVQIRRPDVARLVVPMPESQIGDAPIGDTIARIRRSEEPDGAGLQPR